MLGWATSDAPWAHLIDRDRFASVLAAVRDIAPTRILSSHLPAAEGSSLPYFLRVLESVPDAERFVPAGAEQFGHMLAAMRPLAAV